MCEEMAHTWPKGSSTMPYRSPQNWSVRGINTFAPAATARANAASQSSVQKWILTDDPFRVLGDFRPPKAGISSAR